MNGRLKRVLSIQSHVVHGYVGNKSATFPLQVLGYDVDGINSVQFSNHAGYPCVKGQVLKSDDLKELYFGLEKNQLTTYSHLLTGYVGADSFLLEISEVVKKLKKENPSLLYVCDPVMGDHGRMYVPESLLPIYKKDIIPLADVVTPNQYEAELLTGIKIIDVASAVSAMRELQSMGAKAVVLSSTDLGGDQYLVGLASGSNGEVVEFNMPKLPASFTGTGDLFAALLLAWLDKTGFSMKIACEHVSSTMQAVLQRTLQDYTASKATGPMELRLIQSKSDIEHPTITVHCQLLHNSG